MAAIGTTASKPGRQLGEFLQEQQEPFILEVYLSERGYVGKKKKKNNNNTTSGASFIGFHGNSDKFIKRPKLGTPNKSKKGSIPHIPTVLKVACNKLFITIKGLRTKNSDDGDGNGNGKPGVIDMFRHNQETAEPDRFSLDSSTRAYNSSSDSDIDDEPSSMFSNLKAVVDAKFEWSSVTEDSILSASLWNIVVQTAPEKSSSFAGLTELQGYNSSSQLSISKRVLQKTKQLLLDCVREFVDNNHDKEVVGCEEMEKVIDEKIKGLGKKCGEESGILDSTREWNDFEPHKREIGIAIAEEITNDFVMDMIINFLCYS